MRILIFGPRGYMGKLFLEQYPGSIAADGDIADPAFVASVLDREKPDVIINCAGRTGRPNIDWCEDHKEETLRANVTGPLVLLEETQKRGIYFVHLSSGCIYQGDNEGRGFAESDPPNYWGSFYSRTKIWSDQILSEFPVLLLRMRMPFDGTKSDRSLIMKVRKYSRVLDVENSLTYVPEFLEVAKKLIAKKKTGIYHVVNPGVISPFRIMQLYKEIVDPAHAFEKLSASQLPEVAKTGRSSCSLSTQKLKKEGMTLSPVEDAIRKALTQLRS